MDPKILRENADLPGVDLAVGVIQRDDLSLCALTLKYEVTGHVTSALRVLMNLEQVEQLIFALSELRTQMGGGPLATPKPKLITPRERGA